jgi:iron complex outermembrane receptor protein
MLGTASVIALAASVAGPVGQEQPAAPQDRPGAAPAEAPPLAVNDGTGIGDIVVTASRRRDTVQNTPMAVTAVDGGALASRQIVNLQDLASSLPSVTINPTLGQGRIAIRGVGLDTTQSGSEGRVALHLDGVYISRPSATLSNMFDVDRVEVVRGPQGTLYGRNATAGAINVITNDPARTLGGYLRLTGGNYDLFRAEGALNVPLADDLQFRIAGQITERGGYGRNLTTGKDINDARTRSVRGILKWEPTPDIDVRLSSDYHREHDADYAYHYLGPGNPAVVPVGIRIGGTVSSDIRDTTADTQQANRREFYGANLTVNAHSGIFTLTSVTGYRQSNTAYQGDADDTNALVTVSNQFERAHQWSQEFRSSANFNRGSALMGVYLFDETINGYNLFAPITRATTLGKPDTLATGYRSGGRLRTQAIAVFGEVRYEIVDRLTLVAGGRYSYERKSADEFTSGVNVTLDYVPGVAPPITKTSDQAVDFRAFTPTASFEWRPMAGVLAYATYAQGFKSGGYALGQLAPPFQPERLDDYEIGLKADWLNHRLRTNIAAFYYDYSNLQVSKVLTTGAQTVNAARARVKGVEAEITALPLPHLQFDLTAAYLDGEYLDFETSDPVRPTLGVLDLAGNPLSQAPAYMVNAGLQYTVETNVGKVTLRGEGNWVGRTYFNPFHRTDISQKPYAKFNAFVTYESPSGRWSGSLFVRNITNQDTLSFAYTISPLFGGGIMGAFDPPRTFGGEIGVKF